MVGMDGIFYGPGCALMQHRFQMNRIYVLVFYLCPSVA